MPAEEDNDAGDGDEGEDNDEDDLSAPWPSSKRRSECDAICTLPSLLLAGPTKPSGS